MNKKKSRKSLIVLKDMFSTNINKNDKITTNSSQKHVIAQDVYTNDKSTKYIEKLNKKNYKNYKSQQVKENVNNDSLVNFEKIEKQINQESSNKYYKNMGSKFEYSKMNDNEIDFLSNNSNVNNSRIEYKSTTMSRPNLLSLKPEINFSSSISISNSNSKLLLSAQKNNYYNSNEAPLSAVPNNLPGNPLPNFKSQKYKKLFDKVNPNDVYDLKNDKFKLKHNLNPLDIPPNADNFFNSRKLTDTKSYQNFNQDYVKKFIVNKELENKQSNDFLVYIERQLEKYPDTRMGYSKSIMVENNSPRRVQFNLPDKPVRTPDHFNKPLKRRPDLDMVRSRSENSIPKNSRYYNGYTSVETNSANNYRQGDIFHSYNEENDIKSNSQLQELPRLKLNMDILDKYKDNSNTGNLRQYNNYL